MFKRVLALFLCVVMLAGFVSCTSLKHGIFDKGAYIRAYLTNPIYDFDPLAAFDNEDNLRIVSMMFVGLFRADDNGKPKKDLVDKYTYKEDKKRGEYTLTLYLKKTQWSDGVYVNAGDAQYAFLRLFDSETSHPATALFYDIKNARKIISGDASIDDLGVSVIDPTTLEFKFERPIDLDTFLTALCSPAVYPVRADIVEGKPNWAKRVSTTVCSGPFLLREINYGSEDGFVLERNSYYMRDRQKDDLDKAVRPYRIIVNYLTDHAEQIATLNSGEVGALQYIGYVPLGMRTDASLKKAKVTDAPSTFSLYLNEKALIGGTALFAKTEVRQALSEAVDRNALVEAVTYAKAADGLVPWTVPERAGVRKDFRKKADSYLSASGDIEGAKSKLAAAGVNPANYSFSIAVRKEDPDHVAMVEAVAAAWRELGFRVTVRQLSNYEILDKNDEGNWVGTGMYSSHYTEALDAGDGGRPCGGGTNRFRDEDTDEGRFRGDSTRRVTWQTRQFNSGRLASSGH